MMMLEETVPLMTSEDYRERFRAEYFQTKIRAHKLATMISAYERDELDFTPQTPLLILLQQLAQMLEYLSTLALRGQIEGISLEG